MATSRITIRTIDYHKFRSLVIERDGVGEELRQRCDGDVTALCDAVQRLYDRRERFNDDDDDCRGPAGRDLARFGEICGWYKLILENRRVRSVDVRLRSCWWEVGNCRNVIATMSTMAKTRTRVPRSPTLRKSDLKRP